jgi:hypothetical protein
VCKEAGGNMAIYIVETDGYRPGPLIGAVSQTEILSNIDEAGELGKWKLPRYLASG